MYRMTRLHDLFDDTKYAYTRHLTWYSSIVLRHSASTVDYRAPLVDDGSMRDRGNNSDSNNNNSNMCCYVTPPRVTCTASGSSSSPRNSMSTPFFGDRPCNLGTRVCRWTRANRLPNVCVYYYYFFRQICFMEGGVFGSSTAWQGLIEHVCKQSGSISLKRRTSWAFGLLCGKHA